MLQALTSQARRVRAWCLPWTARWSSDSARKTWQVSSLGRCRDTRGRITYGYLRSSGYYFVMVSGKMWPVHLLVKRTFDGPPPDTEAIQVHHKDGASHNNRLDNLAYVTGSQNMLHFYSGLATRRVRASSSKKPVMWRALGSWDWTLGPSVVEVSKQLGIRSAVLSKCCRLNLKVNGYEYAFASLQQLSLDGEQWRLLIDPLSSKEVEGNLVSSLGRLKLKSGGISEGTLSRSGYARFNFCVGGQKRIEYVHRLVAQAFLGPSPTEHHTHINHKDGIKCNNAVSNLEYATPRENRAHFLATAEKHSRKTASTKPVWSRFVGSKEWQRHPSIKSAASTLGLSYDRISKCARGLLKKTGNHEFQFDAVQEPALLRGEEWREIDIEALVREREARKNRKK